MQSVDPYKKVVLPNGEELAYREAGDPANKTLLMVHGLYGSSKLWVKYFPYFQDKFRLIAVDMRGFGDSSYNKPAKAMADFAEDLKLFCDALSLRRVFLIGWSFGGSVSLQFACRYPEYVEKLILHCSVGAKGCTYQKFDENFQPTAEIITSDEDMKAFPFFSLGEKALRTKDLQHTMDFFEKFCFTGDFKPDKELLQALGEEALKQNVDCFLSAGPALKNFNVSNKTNEQGKGTNEIANLKAPTLILAGEKDVLCVLSEQEFTKKAIGDLAELKVYPNVGHSFFDERREKFIRDVREFLV